MGPSYLEGGGGSATNVRSSLYLALSCFITLVLGAQQESSESTSCTSRPLGMTNGAIKDWQLAASSAMSRADDMQCAVKFARLHESGAKAWCAANKARNEWLLVDLGVASKISGVVSQGRGDVDEWVTHFMISYSLDAYKWEFARDIYGNKKIFKGNSDSHTLRHAYLEHPVDARFVRVHVVDWHGHPAMRIELVGHQECNDIISVVPYSEISASSHKMWRKKRSCTPDMGELTSSKGWCARKQSNHEWLQFDLGPPTTVTGLITRGQGDRRRFVTSYSMSYSNDSSVWYFYKDANHLEGKIFGGNMDKNTERRHYLNVPVVARYIRFHPVSWHRRIGMRAGVIGCKHTGECGQGFMQVNSGSSCIANKAFGKTTWVNDKRHTWKQWRYGHSSLAADGKMDTNLPNCAIMDNYYVDKPIWRVDMGRDVTVNGVVILTWQGAGQDKMTAYTDYVYNLDKLTVYVSNEELDNAESLVPSHKCAAVTRLNNALFNPRLHFDCPEPLTGKYLYVKATGVPNRWRRLFTVVLCEVMVY